MKSHCLVSVVLAAFLVGCGKEQEQEPIVTMDERPALVAVPLESAQPVKPGQPYFTQLSPERTGIDFVHQWKPRDAFESRLLRTGFAGGGVCLGDVDGDRLCDIYLTRPHGGARLYRNLGGFRFEDITVAAGLENENDWTTGAAFVDLDGDGDLDLSVCQHAGPNRLYLNAGNATFREAGKECGLAFAGASIKTVFADYDGDGDLDAFLVTNRLEPRKPRPAKWAGSEGAYRPAPGYEEEIGVINLSNGEQKFAKAGQFDRLFRNELVPSGQLRFSDVSKSAGITGAWHGLDALWWDANGDAFPDLYVANDFTDPDELFINQGDGTFLEVGATSLPHMPWFSMGLGSGDFDGDGRFDLMVADMAGTSHYREKMAMGAMDAVAWFLDYAEPRQYMRNAVYLNTGTGRFLEGGFLLGLAKSNWTWSLKVNDLDGDGQEDIYVTNGFTRDYMDSDFSRSLAARGLSGNPDAWLKAPELRERNLAFSRGEDGRYKDKASAWGLDAEDIAFGAAVGDLDGDGRPDIVVNRFESAPGVYQNGSPGNRLQVRLRGTGKNRDGIGARVRLRIADAWQMRHVQYGKGYLSADEPMLSFGLGTASKADELVVEWPHEKTQVFTDLAGGNLYEITGPPSEGAPAEVSPSKETLFQKADLLAAFPHIERPFDDFSRQPLLPDKQSQTGPWMAWGDIDSDGDQDGYLGGAAGQVGQLLICEKGTFRRQPVPAFEQHQASEDMGCLFVDVDSDGDLDLYVVSGGVECEPGATTLRDRLYLNEGNLQFRHAADALPDLCESGGPVTPSDIDGDGDLDLFVGGRQVPGQYPLAPPSRLFRNDAGRFIDISSQWAPSLATAGMVTDAVWADVDRDQRDDLCITTEFGPVRLYLNRGDRLEEVTEQAGLAALTGWWRGLALADIDQDGDLDLAVSNLGLNTKYQPKPGAPRQLYYGDFDGDGQARCVEAKVGQSGLLPVRGRSCSSDAMPFLKDKFPTFKAFARATLNEIYPPATLQSAVRVEAAEARSGVFRNDGQGHFSFEALPLLAQVAPGFGLSFLEVNGDDLPDLFMAQNSFSPQRETGRMAGGLSTLLVNQGGGRYEPMNATISGIVIPGDANDVAHVDVNQDGLADLVVTINDGPVEVWLRQR